MKFIGIDPGKSGGISVITHDLQDVVAYKMPDTEKDIADLFKEITFEGPYVALIEKVSSMPGQGVKSMFNFGMNYGFLRACLHSNNIPFDDVLPRKWQQHLGCLTKGDKNVTKSKAQQLFPDIKMTHAIADSLLIAKYCYEVNR